jgi:hypothetical protein
LQPQGAFSPSVETDGLRSRNPQSGLDISQPLISINGKTGNRQRIIQQKNNPNPAGLSQKKPVTLSAAKGLFITLLDVSLRLVKHTSCNMTFLTFWTAPLGVGSN